MDLELLLARDDDERSAFLDSSFSERAALSGPKPQLVQPSILLNKGGDLDDMALQRWAVIITKTPEGERLLEIIKPLVALRQEEQGEPRIKVFRVAPGMTVDDVIDWRNNVLQNDPDGMPEWPLYLLILGDLDGVSLELQQLLSGDYIVGRLVFPTEDGYLAYVEKVRQWHQKPYPDFSARALLYTARDRSSATTVGYRALMQPNYERLRKFIDNGKMKAKELLEIASDEPSLDELFEHIRKREPTVLFSMTHGLGAPRGGWKRPEDQRARQGAMSFGEGGVLTAADVASGDFLPGGVWFFLACYGAGTPTSSAYLPWLTQLRDAGESSASLGELVAALPKEGDKPFIAALPQAALANPNGPLAVMAHIDLAWTYSFQDTGRLGLSRIDRFHGIFQQLLDRKRAGIAYKELMSFGTQAAVDLSTRYGSASASSPRTPEEEAKVKARLVQRANLWMLRHDLLGYIFLGDPAVRVPFSEEPIPEPRKRDVHALLGLPSPPAGSQPSRPSLQAMEKMVREALQPGASLDAIAKASSVTKADLKRWADAYAKAGQDVLKKYRT